MNIKKLAGIAFAAVLLTGAVGMAANELERGFENPPANAKPQIWWHWVNNNVTREGITADLEEMKRVGLGGVHIFNVDGKIPNGAIQCLSPEWFALVNHAVKEADRLGLELGLHNCPGWSSSGGPWITPELAQQEVVTSEATARGPAPCSAVLQTPKEVGIYYRDIAVLAFPTPRGESISMKDRHPKITCNIPDFEVAKLVDGKSGSSEVLKAPPGSEQPYVQFEFDEPYPVRYFKLNAILHKPFQLQYSNDGRTFKTIGTYGVGTTGSYHDLMALRRGMQVTGTESVCARFYRIQFQREPEPRIMELGLSDRLGVAQFESKAAVWRLWYSFWKRRLPADNVAALAGQTAPGFVVPREEMIDLTSRLKPDGHLDWEVPSGEWTILRIGHTNSKAENTPAPEGGRGSECDKLSRAAVEAHWAGMMGKIVAASGSLAGKTLVGATIDSWEVKIPNWTSHFPEEFRSRRGYDLHPFLPVLSNRVVESPEVTERFLWDFRRTISDLFVENYYGHMATLARRNGLQLSAECYGSVPMDHLAGAGAVDIPMGEFWINGANTDTCKYAGSAAHTHGHQFASAESFTSGSKWLDHPFGLKSVGDEVYCKGVNRLVIHRYAMQPWKDQSPGMTMGPWGSHIERTSTWWKQGKAWFDYLSRCQFLLQEGRFAADICALGNEDNLAGLSDIPQPSIPAGYDYDLLDWSIFLQGLKVEEGLFALPSGMRYRYLVLPDSKALTLPVVKKVRELVAAGGTVIGPKPQFSPTLQDYPACESAIRRIAAEVWGACDGKTVTENRFGKGRVIWGKSFQELFATTKLPPDFSSDSSSTKINFIHRYSPEADWYFIANGDKAATDTLCTFRVTGKQPEFWYPDTGKIEKARDYWIENGQTYVPVHFDPCGSVFVVFREKAEGTGRKVEIKPVAEPKPLMELSGPWEVSFDSKWFYPDNGMGAKVEFKQLEDWSKRPEEAVKSFSGTAVYEKEFEAPANPESGRMDLDLGRVEVIAEVELNGKNLGVLWKPPFRVDVTEALKPGQKNKLRVKVTNLWPNRLIGDEHLPADCEYAEKGNLVAWPQWLVENKARTSGRRTFTTWRHYKADDPLLPSGLLGPVRLVPATVTTITGK